MGLYKEDFGLIFLVLAYKGNSEGSKRFGQHINEGLISTITIGKLQ